MAKSKKSDDEDALFPDTGQKPVKKPATKKVEKKTETKKVEKVEKKTETKKVPKPVPEEIGSSEEVPAKPASAKPTKLIVGGVVVLAVACAAFLVGPSLVGSGDESQRPKVAHGGPPAPPAPPKPIVIVKPETGPQKPVIPVESVPLKPLVQPKVAPPPDQPAKKAEGKSLKELANKSANHGALARILEQFDAVRKVDLRSPDDRLFADYQAKQKAEADLISQIRALGPAGLDALKDLILNVDEAAYKILLAKALGGMTDRDALKATAELLGSCHDIAVQTTLVRFLPDGPESTAIIAGAFASEGNPNVRAMLLRDYARRVGDPPTDANSPDAANYDASRQMFRQAALQDPDPNVRAEAVSLIGHRGDPRDMDLMAQIVKSEQNLQIRQSAIVAYATTGQDTALPLLDDLARNGDSLEVRASAVLAIARVGNERAIQILDQIAQTDPREEIRSRAQSFATGLRARQHADQNEQRRVNNPKQVPLGRNP